MSGKESRVKLQIVGMSCVSCAAVIRKELQKHEGVKDIKVNPIINAIYVDYEPEKITEEKIEETIKKTGYKAVKLHTM